MKQQKVKYPKPEFEIVYDELIDITCSSLDGLDTNWGNEDGYEDGGSEWD